MASTVGLVPITRAYLAKFYDKYPYSPACSDLASLSSSLREHYKHMEDQLLLNSERNDAGIVASLEFVPPHKIDENFWKNREQIEEILELFKETNLPVALRQQSLQSFEAIFAEIVAALRSLLKEVEDYQLRSSEKVFSMVMTYMPQDFRGLLIKQQRERSEKRRQMEVVTLLSSGGSINDKYALLWQQQMERRRQLAQLGSATGMYKTIVKYLVGVPQVLLDFVRQINDHNGPMEEQRERYGPFLHQLTSLSISIRIFLVVWWKSFDDPSSSTEELLGLVETAVKSYVAEFRHFLIFLGDVFENSPFLISAEEAGITEGIEQIDDFKETIIAPGKTHEMIVTVDCAGSLVAWDFRLTSGKSMYSLVEIARLLQQLTQIMSSLFLLCIYTLSCGMLRDYTCMALMAVESCFLTGAAFFDVLLVQEHKLSTKHSHRCEKLPICASQTFWAPIVGEWSRGRGVCILIGRRYVPHIRQHGVLVLGRAIWFYLLKDNTKIGFLSIYAQIVFCAR